MLGLNLTDTNPREDIYLLASSSQSENVEKAARYFVEKKGMGKKSGRSTRFFIICYVWSTV